MYTKKKNLKRILCCALIMVFMMSPMLLYAMGTPFVFKKENSDAYFAITPEGDIVSTISVDEDEGSFSVPTGDIRIYRESDTSEIIIGITENSIKIRKAISKESDREPGTQSFKIDYTPLDSCEAYLEEVGIYDLFIKGKVYTPDSTINQPTYHKIYIYQDTNDVNPVTTTTYFDGVGRGIQTQLKQNLAFSQISGVYYDEAGRAQIATKTASLATLNQYYSLYEDSTKKLLNVTNNYYPEADGKAYSENGYYSEPLSRMNKIGEPGLEYSLDSIDGNYSEIWYFSSTGSNNDPVLLKWFSPEGFIYPYRFDGTNWVESVEARLQYIYETYPDSIQYSLTVIKDPDGNYTQVLKDKFNRTVRTWADSDKDKFNAKGEILSEYSYDIMGNILESIPPKDRDSADYPEKLLDNTSLVYDSYGRVIKETNPDKGVTTYEYDNAGNLVTLTKAAGSSDLEITMDYDYLDRVTIIKAEGKEQIKRYYDNTEAMIELDQYLLTGDDANIRLIITGELENLRGNPVAEVSIGYDPANDTTDIPDYNRCVVDMYSYDEENRIKARYKYVPGISWQKFSFSYDLQNKIISKTAFARYKQTSLTDSVVFYYNYDNLGRLLFVTNDNHNDTVYAIAYDPVGKVDEKRYFKENSTDIAKKVSYDYNIRDWLTEIDAGTHFSEEISYTGNYTGNITNSKYNYNLTGESQSYDLDYTYDGINRLTSVEHDSAGEEYSEALRYDQVGRIKQKRKGENNLTDFSPEYQYDGFTSKLNYITDIQQANNYSWDDNGNMIMDVSKKLDSVKYDWRDMPVRFTLQDRGTWRSTVDMVYDASGNRVLKKDNVEEDGVVTRAKAVAYVYNDMVFKNDNVQVEEYELQYYNIDGEGKREYGSNTSYYYIKNHLGSTHFVVNDEGDYIEATMYDAYGKMEQLAYSGDIGPVRDKFTGKEFDEEGFVNGRTDGLGLYYFGVRYYDPEVGVWNTSDPINEYWNSYCYVGGNVINSKDPDGLASVVGKGADGSTISITFTLNPNTGTISGTVSQGAPASSPSSSSTSNSNAPAGQGGTPSSQGGTPSVSLL